MSKGFLIIMGGVLIIMMIAFGNNPVEEARIKREKNSTGDPVIDAINRYNEDNPMRAKYGSTGLGGGMGRGAMGMGTGMGMDDNTPAPPPGRNPNAYNTTAPNAYVVPPHMRKDGGDPYQHMNQDPYRMPQDAAPAQDSYYPPAPRSKNPTQQPGLPPQSSLRIPDVFGGIATTTGQKIRFSGIHVYTTDARGEMVPLPDGVYTMPGGKATVEVRNGKRVVHN